jgi:type I restriction enzyme S subunit
MASVSEEGKILRQETRKLGETKKGYTYFERNDVLLAKITPCFENGKAALASELEHPIGFGSTEFCIGLRFFGHVFG